MQSYGDIPNIEEVVKIKNDVNDQVKQTGSFVIDQVQRDVAGRTNLINSNVKEMSDSVLHLKGEMDNIKTRVTSTTILIIALQLVIILILLWEFLP